MYIVQAHYRQEGKVRNYGLSSQDAAERLKRRLDKRDEVLCSVVFDFAKGEITTGSGSFVFPEFKKVTV